MGRGEPTDRCSCFNVEVPRDELLRRLSGRRWCPTCQATYHVDNNPPRTTPGSATTTAPLIQREDDKETAVARRLGSTTSARRR